MAETRERRRRQPKRPAVYLALLVLGGALALGAAWQATRPVTVTGVVWRGKPTFVRYSDAGNARAAEARPR